MEQGGAPVDSRRTVRSSLSELDHLLCVGFERHSFCARHDRLWVETDRLKAPRMITSDPGSVLMQCCLLRDDNALN